MPNPWEKYASQQSGAIVQLPQTPTQRAEEARKAAADMREQMRLKLALQAAQRAQTEFDMKYATLPTPGDTTKSGEEYLATLPKALAAQVKALADGRRAFPTGAALRSPQIQELVAAASQYDPTLDAANAATRVATRKDFTSGKAAQNITAMNTALGHLGSLAKAAGALDNSSFRLWNNIGNAAVTAVGDPRVKNFTLARDAVANELMKVFRGTGGSVAEIQEWQHNIDAADSPAQLRATITQATELLRSRLESMNEQYTRGMGKSGDPMQLLSPHAQEIYKQITESPDPLKPVPGAGGAAGATGMGPGGGPNGGAGGGGGVPLVPASGGTQTIASPELSAQVDAMMNAGATRDQINAALAEKGFPEIKPETYNAAKAWMQANPGKAYYGSNITKQQDLNLLQQAAGSAPGAFIAHMANDFTGGTVGALAGDKGKGALDAMAQMSPNASAAGSILGGITGAATGEGLLANTAPAAFAKYAPRAADALYGGLSGFNQADEGNGGTSALTGAGLGLVGGAVGEKAMRGASAVARGMQANAARYLRDQGIPLTIGQVVGNSGAIGRGIKKIEDAATAIPLVGNVIDARRKEGLRAFNQRAFNIGAQPVGGQIDNIGRQGISDLNALKSNAYSSALDPVTIDASHPQFAQDVGAAWQAAQGIPNVGGAQDAATAALQNRIGGAIDPNTDLMPGRNFQEAYRGLARTGRERANGDYGHEVGQVMRQGQDALASALEAQNPGAFQAFQNANSTNRRLNVLSDAVNAAKNQEGQMFTPAQLNIADTGSARRFTGNISAAAGDRPFAELADAGQQVLPSKVPDSGTASRLMVQRALAALALTGAGGGVGYASGGAEGAGTGTASGLAAAALLALGGSKGVQRAGVSALLDRPESALAVSKFLQQRAALGRALGAGSFPLLAPGN